jgi:hypothetical protein
MTAGEQSLLGVCLFIKQWYGIQQAQHVKEDNKAVTESTRVSKSGGTVQ